MAPRLRVDDPKEVTDMSEAISPPSTDYCVVCGESWLDHTTRKGDDGSNEVLCPEEVAA